MTDEQRMQPVTDWLGQHKPYDTLDIARLAKLMAVPAQALRDQAERRLLPDPTWKPEGQAWEVGEFRRWYKNGGLATLATFARLHGDGRGAYL